MIDALPLHGVLVAELGESLRVVTPVFFDLAPELEEDLAADGTLKPEWRALFERFPDRFMWGMDVQSVDSAAGIAGRLATARAAFAELPQALEENIAYRNISRVMKGCSGLPLG